MRFVTAKKDNEIFVGLLEEESVLHIKKAADQLDGSITISDSMIECIANANFIDDVQKVKENMEGNHAFLYSIKEVELLAPIPRPSKNIFCIGKNYAAHAIEMGSAADIPEHPMVFSKAPTTVIGHDGTILNHKNVTTALDYEGELAVVIGKTGRGITKEQAMEYVFGYTIINDITGRDLQERHKQFLLGKSLDTTCPMGPAIVHHSLIEDPHKLNIETKVNGEIRQDSNTENFIFDIPTLISTLSNGITLEAGDIIATGTPAGVGKGFKPPRYLNPGDVVEVTIERIGTLKNTIEA